jgi:spore germination cell wall hydrolase CwlJ-like protein
MLFKVSLSNVKEISMERVLRIICIVLSIFVTILVVHASINYKMNNLLITDIEPKEIVTAEQRSKQLDCLAMNIYREAGYEPFEGKVAVAQVTMNRVESSQFPNDVCAVVYQKTKATKVVCQFSWYCDSTHRNRPLGPGYEESYEVAKKVLLENFKLSSITEALYYHADYVNPNWNKTKVATIGRHIFYKDKGKSNGSI